MTVSFSKLEAGTKYQIACQAISNSKYQSKTLEVETVAAPVGKFSIAPETGT